MNEINNDRLMMCQSEIANKLRTNSKYTGGDAIATVAFLLAQAAKCNDPFGVELSVAIADAKEVGVDLRYASDLLSESDWKELLYMCMDFSCDTFMKVAAMPSPNMDKRDDLETPVCLSRLAVRLLNVAQNEMVADFCCGHGGAAIELAQMDLDSPVQGIEKNEEVATAAKIRVIATGANVEVLQGDVFNIPASQDRSDKIFCNYPFGLHLRELGTKHEYLQTIAKKVPSLSKATSSDWLFNHLLIDSLNVGGKAVAVMTNGSTWNTIDRKIREYFVEQGYIECIISLPAKLFASTNISTTMIVLSHGNEKIRMIDATEVCTKGRRLNLLSEADIDKIIAACNEDSEISKELSVEELRESDYVLHPGRYFVEKADEGVPFETVIKSINRGAHCTAEQLDDMSTREQTNIHFLKTADIQDGLIVGPLQCLSYIEENFEKYCIRDRDLIISKIGAPAYKVAVASVEEGSKLLANANLYVVELDETKVDPYYLKAYLESAEGQNRFRNITAGTTVMSIGVKDLKAMMIPLPPLEEQKRIAARYKEVMEEVLRLKAQLQDATERMKRVFEDSVQ